MPVAGVVLCNATTSWQVQDEFPVLVKELPRQDLGEDVGRIRLTGDVAHVDDACTTQLAHFEQLAIDVTRVLRRGEAMA